jgi:pyruvate dehydrogenase E2 component (dihydrolipoyllysine-residue acetyltransferase)
MAGEIQPIVMPKWGLAMEEGVVTAWNVAEGATITKGQEIADIETSKIANVFESPIAGPLRRLVAQTGETLPVGALLAVVADKSVGDAELDAYIAKFNEALMAALAAKASEKKAEPETVEIAGGRKIRYLKLGNTDGPPIVFVHGFGGDLNNWLFNAEPLASDRAVYALDLPGHGGSIKQAGDGDVGLLVGAVREFLDSQGIERAHLAGHSMGGLVAAELALADPDRVLSLALVAPAGLGAEIDAEYIEGFVAASGRRDLKPVLQRLFADPSLVNRQMVDDVLKYKRLDGVQGSLEMLSGSLFPDGRQTRVLAAELEDGYGGPLLVIWGERDAIIPPAHAEAAPSRAETHVLPDVGHSPHMEAAGDVNRLLEGFLAGVRAG